MLWCYRHRTLRVVVEPARTGGDGFGTHALSVGMKGCRDHPAWTGRMIPPNGLLARGGRARNRGCTPSELYQGTRGNDTPQRTRGRLGAHGHGRPPVVRLSPIHRKERIAAFACLMRNQASILIESRQSHSSSRAGNESQLGPARSGLGAMGRRHRLPPTAPESPPTSTMLRPARPAAFHCN